MDKYAIYYYKCNDAPVEGNFLQGEKVVRPDTSEEHCREMIYALFGEKNAELIFKLCNVKLIAGIHENN